MTDRDAGSLAVLADLKREEERAAAGQLRRALEQLEHELDRMATVEGYLDDYRARHGALVSQSRELQDRRGFLQQLLRSVEAQRAVAAGQRQRVEAARAHWIAVRLQREALDKLLGQRAGRAAQQQRRAEQRHSDELAARLRICLGAGPLS